MRVDPSVILNARSLKTKNSQGNSESSPDFSSMTSSDNLTAAWREEDSPSRHFDLALQLVPYRRKAGNAKSESARDMDPQERKNLITGLSNPLLYHRHSRCLSRLQDVILSLETARKIARDAKLTEDWQELVALAIKCAERAWEAFINPLAWMNQRRYVEAGDTGGMWKEDRKCKLAIEYRLRELAKSKERCISASKPKVFFFRPLHLR